MVLKRDAESALQQLHIDADGLDAMDRRYLDCLIHNYGGGPVGIDTLAAALSEEAETLQDVVEPFSPADGLSAADACRPRRHGVGPGPGWTWNRLREEPFPGCSRRTTGRRDGPADDE